MEEILMCCYLGVMVFMYCLMSKDCCLYLLIRVF